jgi:hypothetical protein
VHIKGTTEKIIFKGSADLSQGITGKKKKKGKIKSSADISE